MSEMRVNSLIGHSFWEQTLSQWTVFNQGVLCAMLITISIVALFIAAEFIIDPLLCVC